FLYFLKPEFNEIKQVKINQPTFKNILNIGELIDDHSSFGGMKANWTVVNYFPYDENYASTKFIKSVKFLSQVRKKKKGKIKLVFYKNENGKPSAEIWKTYIAECSTKKESTEYRLKRPVQFPQEGIFI